MTSGINRNGSVIELLFAEMHLVDDATTLYDSLCANNDQVNFLQNIPVIEQIK